MTPNTFTHPGVGGGPPSGVPLSFVDIDGSTCIWLLRLGDYSPGLARISFIKLISACCPATISAQSLVISGSRMGASLHIRIAAA